jgi:hypothetical protein
MLRPYNPDIYILYACIYTCVCIWIYMYIYIERERERIYIHTHTLTHMYMCIYISYIWTQWNMSRAMGGNPAFHTSFNEFETRKFYRLFFRNGIPKEREVDMSRETCEWEGWLCVSEPTGAPSMWRLIRKAVASAIYVCGRISKKVLLLFII